MDIAHTRIAKCSPDGGGCDRCRVWPVRVGAGLGFEGSGGFGGSQEEPGLAGWGLKCKFYCGEVNALTLASGGDPGIWGVEWRHAGLRQGQVRSGGVRCG